MIDATASAADRPTAVSSRCRHAIPTHTTSQAQRRQGRAVVGRRAAMCGEGEWGTETGR
jgi:hypothetical protein